MTELLLRLAEPMEARSLRGREVASRLGGDVLGREARLRPLFNDALRPRLASLTARARRRTPDFEPPDFERYAQLSLRDDVAYAALRALPAVSDATRLATAGPDATVNRPVLGEDRGVSRQRYLQPAPQGVDAFAAWRLGADGAGQVLVDVERGWALDHRDLRDHDLRLCHGENAPTHAGHGTSVLGIACARETGPDAPRPHAGCTGIAPRVKRIDLFALRTDGADLTEVLVHALDRPAGDVVLIEAQTPLIVSRHHLLGPVDAHDPLFDLVSTAVAAGVVVIEVAGNGAVDERLALDMDRFAVPTLRGGPRYPLRDRDSGALLVTAATAGPPYEALPHAAHGRRVDFFAPGRDVFAPDSREGGPSHYRHDFGGTSAAGAIVAGCALALQSLHHRETGRHLDSRALRRHLAVGGTAPAPGQPAMGVMPNLAAAGEALLRALRTPGARPGGRCGARAWP